MSDFNRDHITIQTQPVNTEIAPETQTAQATTAEIKDRRQPWLLALKESFPVFLALRLSLFAITIYTVFFHVRDFDNHVIPINVLWNSWNHWDVGHYISIARYGYHISWQTAFFPFYPLLIRLLLHLVPDPLGSSMIIANIAGLGTLVVLYRLVKEDFNQKLAQRTILYLSFFPTAFFLAAGYNETTFLFFILLSFYYIRKGNWWLAGSFGLLASLTRAAGLFLVLPFCYDYLLQHDFKLKHIRFDILACSLIPLGTLLFGSYCYLKFHDPLAFSHAQTHWQRFLAPPWQGFNEAIIEIINNGSLLSFPTLRNLLDLIPDLMVLFAIMFMFVGPWRLPAKCRSYALYTLILYFFFMLLPTANAGRYPLQSTGRFMLELFPAFIILAAIGKNRIFHLTYLALSMALLFFMTILFLNHRWIV